MTKTKQFNITPCQKAIKYILIGFIIMISVRYIPNSILQNKEIIIIGAISSISYAVLDIVSPSIVIQPIK